MGNCFHRGSTSMVWADDEWESSYSEKDDRRSSPFNGQPTHLIRPKDSSSSSASKSLASTRSSTTEVKIKITKKELEELLGKAKEQNLSPEQVLAYLIHAGSGGYRFHHHRDRHHWRPGLTSIPEVN